MRDANGYSAQAIEELQQKVNTYKDTLSALKGGNSIEEVLFMKAEFTNFKEKTTALETLIETMKDNQNQQIDLYKKEISSLSSQIESLNTVVEQLNKKITSTASTENKVDSNLVKQNSPMTDTQTRKKPTQKQQHVIPSYTQLQKLSTQTQAIEDIEFRSSPQATNQNQQHTQQSSAPINTSRYQPEQFNTRRKPFNDLNEPTTQQRISYKFSNVSAIPLSIHTPTHHSIREELPKTQVPNIIQAEPTDVSNDAERTDNKAATDRTEKFSMNDILTHKLDELLKSDEMIQKIETIYQAQHKEKASNTHHNMESMSTNKQLKTPAMTELKKESIEPLAPPTQQDTESKAAPSLLNFFRKK